MAQQNVFVAGNCSVIPILNNAFNGINIAIDNIKGGAKGSKPAFDKGNPASKKDMETTSPKNPTQSDSKEK